MKNLVVLALGVLAVASARGAAPSDSGRPNVLVLHVDQLRIDCLGTYGNPDIANRSSTTIGPRCRRP